MDRESLLEQLEIEFQTFLQAVNGLNERQMTQVWYGAWGVREIVAHLAGWLHEGAAMLERIASGEPSVAGGADRGDDDAVNARFVEERRGMSAAALLADLDAAHGALVAAARAIPLGGFPEGGPAYHIVSDTINDYRHHDPPIREWRQREGI